MFPTSRPVFPPTVLVTSAAIVDDKLFLESTPDDWLRMLDKATGIFQIISEDDFRSLAERNGDLRNADCPSDLTAEPLRDYADSDSVSLVSTKALRRVFDDHEMVVFFRDKATGLKAIIAIHSTVLGPAAGGRVSRVVGVPGDATTWLVTTTGRL